MEVGIVSSHPVTSCGAIEAYCTLRPEKFWAPHDVASRRRKIDLKDIVASWGMW